MQQNVWKYTCTSSQTVHNCNESTKIIALFKAVINYWRKTHFLSFLDQSNRVEKSEKERKKKGNIVYLLFIYFLFINNLPAPALMPCTTWNNICNHFSNQQHYNSQQLVFTLVAPSSETRIQRRVLPELTEPPSLVNNVCSLMLNVECEISTALSKTTSIVE